VRRGCSPTPLKLSNEPDGDWNMLIAPPDYAVLVKTVRVEAKRRSVALPKIYGPGTSTLAALRDYLREPNVALSILDNIDVLSVHGWDNPNKRNRFLDLDALFADLRNLGRAPELAVTEYGLARPEPADTSDRMNVKTRSPENVANTPYFASISARDLMRFYAKGIGTVIHWEFHDQSWGKASFGLLDEKGNERPIYRTMREISEYLAIARPQRIDGTTAAESFVARRTGHDDLWSVNSSRDPMDVVFTDRTKAVGAPSTKLLPCRGQEGKAGLTLPPWSVVSSPIARP